MDAQATEGATPTARDAAAQMTSGGLDDLKHDLVGEGAYATVVEMGHHTEALSDREADFLTLLVVEEGTTGLERFADGDHSQYSPVC